MPRKIYHVIILVSFGVSCSSKNIPPQEMQSEKEVQLEKKPKKSALDSAQAIKINNRNRTKSILSPSKSKEKKGL